MTKKLPLKNHKIYHVLIVFLAVGELHISYNAVQTKTHKNTKNTGILFKACGIVLCGVDWTTDYYSFASDQPEKQVYHSLRQNVLHARGLCDNFEKDYCKIGLECSSTLHIYIVCSML